MRRSRFFSYVNSSVIQEKWHDSILEQRLSNVWEEEMNQGQSSSSPVPMALHPLNPLGALTLKCQHPGGRGGRIFKACLGYIGRTRL